MPIDEKTFDELAKKKIEGPYNSWAFWDEDFPDKNSVCSNPEKIYDYLKDNLKILNPNVILLGYNPTLGLSTEYESFHITTNRKRETKDGRLKWLIQCSSHNRKNDDIKGAFMTDLYSLPSKSAKKLKKRLKKDRKLVKKSKYNLLKKISILIKDKKFRKEKGMTIICMGNDAFCGFIQMFRDELHGFKISIFKLKRSESLLCIKGEIPINKKTVKIKVGFMNHYSSRIKNKEKVILEQLKCLNDFIERE